MPLDTLLLAPDPEMEIALAAALIAGAPGAAEEFITLFRQKVFQYSYMMCRQREDAEEVAQETLLRAFRRISTLRDPSRVRTWVFRIARNVCFVSRRKSRFGPAWEEPIAVVRDHAAGPERQLLGNEMKRRLDEALAVLPQGQRAVFLLREFEQLSTEETAEVLDVSVDVVKTRLSRARRALRLRMVDYAGTGR